MPQNPYRFSSASPTETIVFGAARPGHTSAKVRQWIEFMEAQEIQRVCCLLTEAQLQPYGNLKQIYTAAFGIAHLCFSPIEDFQVASTMQLKYEILPFLQAADAAQEKVVVHCAGGIGRTGQVLTAWLIHSRSYTIPNAIATVKKQGRNPYEAVVAATLKCNSPRQVKQTIDQLFEAMRPS